VASESVRIREPIKFGEDFELDVRAYELRRSGKALKLERIPMELLVLLVEQRGQLVTRDQIVERIWGKGVFLDTDNSINAAIRKIRQVLKDDRDRPRFVLTVTGKGYRFVARVEEVSAAPAGPAVSPPAPSGESLLGRRISHYRILQMLGGGGMGVVYKAEDLKLGRLVALKLLPSELASDPIAFERLQREARAASALDHPNICSIYQLGEHEGQPFIVMQLLEGQTLRDWIETAAAHDPASRLSNVLDLATQITEGLEAAHAKGIIHRDIKPANIFITSRGHAKILDFGVAKFVDTVELHDGKHAAEDEGSDTRIPDPYMTRTGASIGTPSYLSPEQIRREKLDARTDLFSFGLVLYEMATGQRAFSGNTATTIRDAVVNLPAVPVRQLNPDLPTELERIINKAQEKDHGRRYQSAQEFRLDLERLRAGLAPVAQPRSKTWAWVFAGIVVIALVMLSMNVGGLRDRVFHRSEQRASVAEFTVRPSVAVLGFKNLSGRDDEAWISTALSEMLGAELAAGQQLRIVPGENVARMKLDLSLAPAESYGQDTLRRIRNHLNIDLVVLGSYLALGKRSNGKVRVDLQLQDTKSGETLAVISQDGTEADLAELVSRSGINLRQKLGVGDLSASDARHVRATVPANLEAARFYAKGLAKLEQSDALNARELLEKAVTTDPSHALTHSALAEAWSALGYDAKAQQEAKTAFDLSAGLPREQRLAVEGRYREFAHDFAAAIEIYRTLSNFFPDDLDYGLRLANTQLKADNGRDALGTIARMRSLPPPASNDARIDLVEANTADALGDFKRAQEMGAAAATKAQLQGSRLLLAQAKEREGWAWDSLGNIDKATARLSEAGELFAAGGNPRSSAIVLIDRGDVLLDTGDFAGARKLYEEALRIFRQTGAQQKTAVTLSRLGSLSLFQGRSEEAKQYQEAALRLDREIGSATARDLGNLANTLEALGDLIGATRMGEQSVQEYRQGGDKSSEAVGLSNLADVLLKRGEIDSAKADVERAIELEQEMGYKRPLGFSMLLMTQILLAQDKLEAAQFTAERAITLRKELKDEARVRESEMLLAEIALEKGKVAEAESLTRTAAAAFDELKMADLGTEAYANLARALLAQEKTHEAQVAAARSMALSRQAGDRAEHFEATLATAAVLTESGRSAEAAKALEILRTEASGYGYVVYEMESRLQLGHLEIKSGKGAAARARLAQLQIDARNKGILLIARKANAALNHL